MNVPAELARTGGHAGVYLSFPECVTGDQVSVDELPDDSVRRELQLLREQCVGHCRVSARPLLELAAESASGTWLRAGRPPLDSVVFCTDTSFDGGVSGALGDLLGRLGAPVGSALAVGGSGCGNLGPGLATARNLIQANGASAVLLVTADAVGDGARYLPSSTTVLSDGAAACLVTSEPAGKSFKVLGLASSFHADKGAPSGLVNAKGIVALVRRAVAGAFAELPVSAESCRFLLTGHYGRTTCALLALAARVDPKNVYRPLADEMGHCFAADVLAGLGRLAQDPAGEPGDVVLLVTTGSRSCTAVVAMLTEAPE
ncbi:hypothetical protein [Amycolatopsis sp. NPDC003676]